MQKRMLQELVPHVQRILVVGDRKQSIYGFRGANESILVQMAIDSGLADVLPLTISRRPTKPLLEVQNLLFQNMSRRYPVMKDLLTVPPSARKPKDRLLPMQFLHVDSKEISVRIQRTVALVQRLLSEQIDDEEKGVRPVELNDICVLFRSNYALKQYAQVFREVPLEIELDTEGGLFQKPEIVGFYYMLQAILKYPNDVSIALLQRTPYLPFACPITPTIYSRNVHTLCAWLASTPALERWYKGMMDVRRRAKLDLVPQLIAHIFEFTGIREIYAKENDYQAVANLEKLLSWSRELMNAEALTLQQFADRLQTAILTNEKVDEADSDEKQETGIRFSTVHSAKGLEFPIVIIPELHKRILDPSKEPIFFEEENFGLDISLPGDLGRSARFGEWMERYRERMLYEEARVFYVAVTRAQQAICFVSGGVTFISNREYWSWKDEVLSAKSDLLREARQWVQFT
jgi:ATP-dependent exoDNAse (exonuclease V) beta subunit